MMCGFGETCGVGLFLRESIRKIGEQVSTLFMFDFVIALSCRCSEFRNDGHTKATSTKHI